MQRPMGDRGDDCKGSGFCQEHTYSDTYADSSKDQNTYAEADSNTYTKTNQEHIWIYCSFRRNM